MDKIYMCLCVVICITGCRGTIPDDSIRKLMARTMLRGRLVARSQEGEVCSSMMECVNNLYDDLSPFNNPDITEEQLRNMCPTLNVAVDTAYQCILGTFEECNGFRGEREVIDQIASKLQTICTASENINEVPKECESKDVKDLETCEKAFITSMGQCLLSELDELSMEAVSCLNTVIDRNPSCYDRKRNHWNNMINSVVEAEMACTNNV